MASGYVTADGKDLDSRYLGISDKAASAKTADNVTNKGTITRNGNPIMFTLKGTGSYTATKAGVVAEAEENSTSVRGLKVNGSYVGKAVFVQSGDKITCPNLGTTYSESYTLFPIKVS